jgi:hypothetical protein
LRQIKLQGIGVKNTLFTTFYRTGETWPLRAAIRPAAHAACAGQTTRRVAPFVQAFLNILPDHAELRSKPAAATGAQLRQPANHALQQPRAFG